MIVREISLNKCLFIPFSLLLLYNIGKIICLLLFYNLLNKHFTLNNLFSLIDTNIILQDFENKKSGKIIDISNKYKIIIYKEKYIKDINFEHFFFRRYFC